MSVLTILMLHLGTARCFSWDIVVGGEKQLDFFHNGTLTHTEEIPSAHCITSLSYDPVHYRLLITDFTYYGQTTLICSFNLSAMNIQPLLSIRASDYYMRVAYDPVTQFLFWKNAFGLYSFSLNPVSPNTTANGSLLVMLDNYCFDIVVDSCGGYIYWITDNEIERARLDGSEREVLIKSWVWVRLSLAIDQHAQKIYWIDIPYSDKEIFMKSANLDGKNRTTLHILRNTSDFLAHTLAVTKDFIYWLDEERMEIWTLQKNKTEDRLYSNISFVCSLCHRVAANYTIEEEIQGPKSCTPQGLITNGSKECTGSICQNHCLEGDCSVNTERPRKVAVVLGNGVKSTFASTIVNVYLLFYTYFVHFVISL